MKSKLRVLLDLDTLKSAKAKNLLQYNAHNQFELITLKQSNKNVDLTVEIDTKNGLNYGNWIEIDKRSSITNPYHERSAFAHSYNDIQDLSKYLGLSSKDLVLAYILEDLSESREQKIILVTQNQNLLDLASGRKANTHLHFPEHSILNPDEASIYIDLYCKSIDKYLIGPNCYANKGLWYLLSMKHKVSEYQSMWSTLVYGQKKIPNGKLFTEIGASLGDRIIDMLVAVDEIGQNYYDGSNNDTKDNTIYHFNYWITLFTGVLDSLAWLTIYRYDFVNDFLKKYLEIGLRKKENKKFLNKINKYNKNLFVFVNNSTKLTNLIYLPRNIVVHRSRMKGIRVCSKENGMKLNMVHIPKIFFDNIKDISSEKGDVKNDWGHFTPGHDLYLLEPYAFVKKTTMLLIEFTNEYLKLLDFKSYGESFSITKTENKEMDEFRKMLKGFGEYKLGY